MASTKNQVLSVSTEARLKRLPNHILHRQSFKFRIRISQSKNQYRSCNRPDAQPPLYKIYITLLKLLKPGRNMMEEGQKNNPLHGKTLESMVVRLVEIYGWEDLGSIIRIKCFNDNPSVQSSLKFLRKTEWARKKVEELYIGSNH